MDTSDPDISFDSDGRCNHCTRTIKVLELNYNDDKKNHDELNNIFKKIMQEKGKGKYDCIIGLSGGIDSSFLAYSLVKNYGLNPLAVHVDNGWNSNQAVSNIHKIVNLLNIDLYTHVINWEEFKELQKSFLFASVVDLEMISDHAIVVIINKLAIRHRIKYFCIGSNFQTESIMPDKWFYSDKTDSLNIKDIYKKYGNGRRIKTFPFLSFYEYFFFGRKYGKYLMPLTFMDYNKDAAKELLINELGWEDYGAKHTESFITKFYQTYILPEKFRIDKRRAHLSSLICANQLTREKAIEILDKPFIDKKETEESILYFCKKMGFSKLEFEQIMQIPIKEHSDFKSYKQPKERLLGVINNFRKKKRLKY
jgi:N-acetyl sugar amidotransferase